MRAGPGVHRSQFKQLSRARLREARVLHAGREWAGAYYLAGYSAECALKAVVCRTFRSGFLPDQKKVADTYTHKLRPLAKVAGLALELERRERADPDFATNWQIVVDWTEQSRYAVDITELMARDILAALTARHHGVLPWIRTHW